MSAVSEIMSKGAVAVDLEPGTSALDVASAMVRGRAGAIIAIKSGRPAGIITERDLLKKVAAKNIKPDQVRAEDIMSSPLVTVKAYDSVDTAAGLMARNRIKRLPVLEDDGSLAGMLSATDIAKRLAKILADDQSRYSSLRPALEL
ncbi:CBS domain-containing protein [Nitrososphaera viennensis]|uniref:CBS domain-containing protein n=2 Tax=Nitrososphaera viennensis TaxID=1034015 RepID=A0A977IGE1_9ARCH|nr:CBS domain-containing protein [Nitrososphaera viennensis]AIC15371.1 putative signal transduction protein with CBS domains [Nitrososphaera viennensis EN76]UVS70268.1 CBS domain-containing protein [Nitrososphaera viennensis]